MIFGLAELELCFQASQIRVFLSPTEGLPMIKEPKVLIVNFGKV